MRRSLAPLARRISAWTTRGLLTLLIVLVCAQVGREAVRLWRQDAEAPPVRRGDPRAMAGGGLADATVAQVIEAGDSPWTMRRQQVPGDRAAAQAALRRLCAAELKIGGWPADALRPAEQRLLTSLANRKPALSAADGGRLYELDGPFPMTVGVRPSPRDTPQRGPARFSADTINTESEPTTPKNVPVPGQPVAVSAVRMVTWGLAIPADATSWTLLVLRPSSSPAADRPTLPLPFPPDGRCSVALTAPDGGAMATFRGAGRLEDWQAFYDRWITEHGWVIRQAWQPTATGRRTRLEEPQRRSTVELRLWSDSDGHLSGLILVIPPDIPSDERRHP